MDLVKSELVLEDFFIVKSSYSFIEPQNDNIDVKELINDYDIDIDFIVRDIKNENNKYIVFAKVSINDGDNVMPGYSLFAEGVSIYSFDPNAKISEKEKSDFLWTSGVSIAINCLRNYLTSTTTYSPLGKYMLPSVNLTSLLNTKRDSLSTQENAKKSKKKAKK